MYILICTHASPLPPPPKARRGSKASSPPLRLTPFYSQLIGRGGVPPPSPLLIFMIKGSERGGKKPFPTSIFLSLISSRTLSLGLLLCRLLSQAPPFTVPSLWDLCLIALSPYNHVANLSLKLISHWHPSPMPGQTASTLALEEAPSCFLMGLSGIGNPYSQKTGIQGVVP